MYNAKHRYEFGLLRSPGLFRLALEWRAVWQYGAMLAAQPLLSRGPRATVKIGRASCRERV
jgi:hypothetical protein